MTPQTQSVEPPRIAGWLLKLFMAGEQAESIQGDLLEEFSQIALTSGVAVARRWYWGQTMKTVPHFAASGFRGAPVSTLAAVAGGYLLFRFVYGLPDKLLMALTDRYLTFWQSHFNTYVFLSTYGIWIVHVIALTIVGCVVALAAKGREMIAAMALSLIVGAMGGVALLWFMATWQAPLDGWMLAFQFFDPVAIVTGGVVVRLRRNDKRVQAA